MWYLIIPPFIIVLSLGGLLWFLSRRMGDADIAEKLSSLNGSTQTESQSRALSRKAFFLKILEMLASRFKTMTLRIHNFFQQSLERLRRQRTELDTMRKSIGREKERLPKDASSRSNFFSRLKPEEPHASPAFPEPSSFPQPATKHPSSTASLSAQGTATEYASRPMLRDEVAHPDGALNREGMGAPVSQTGPREETLIARIVENPRDAAAYEELGDCYFEAGNLQDAKECYRQAIKLHPTNRAVKIKIRRLEKVFEEKAR
ncbi:MAG: tetratricopeptide repeat protein [Candidatus Moraniibacteriota bacterium]